MQQAEVLEMQKLVEKLDGIIAAKFVADENGGLSEIHILADKGKNPKQLSRDIQSALCAATGLNIEHKIISIAQIGDDMTKTEERLVASGLDMSYKNNEFSATVALSAGEKSYTGTAKNVPGSVSRYTTIANACMEAVHQYLGTSVFYVCDVQKIRISSYNAISIAVSYHQRNDEKMLSGTAFVTDDEYFSTVRAALDAVNRILPRYAG